MGIKLNTALGGSITLEPTNTTNNVTVNLPVIANGSIVVANSSGNVGIGTNSPTARLQVAGIAAINGNALAADYALNIQGSSGVTGGLVAFSPDSTMSTTLYSDQGASTAIIGARTNHPVGIITNSSERMRFDTSGNVLIGTTSTAISTFGTGKLNVTGGNGLYVAGYGDAVGFGSVYKQSGSAAGNLGWPLFFVNSGEVNVGGIRQSNTNVEYHTGVGGVGGAGAVLRSNGVAFPVTQSASSDANTLDDYEEGTWTPAFLALSGSVTVTYGNRYGRYTKIGNVVYADFLVAWSARSGGDGLLALSMPFAPFAGGNAHNGSGVIAYASGLPVNSLLYGDAGAARAVFIKSGTANSYFSPSELGSGGGQIMGAFTFHTT